jgi:hypothetical protein
MFGVGGIDDVEKNESIDDGTNDFKYNGEGVGLGNFSIPSENNGLADNDDTEKDDDVRDNNVVSEDCSRDKAHGGSEVVLGEDF